MKVFLNYFVFIWFAVFSDYSFASRIVDTPDSGVRGLATSFDSLAEGYICLKYQTYFPCKIPPVTHKKCSDYTLLPEDDERKIAICRNAIAQKANLKTVLERVNFDSVSKNFQAILQERINDLETLGVPVSKAQKVSIVVSKHVSWRDGIALLKKIYGDEESSSNLENSLALIFLRVDSPMRLTYLFSSKDKQKDETFFYNCMKNAIACFMKEVNGYTGPDPLDACEKTYCVSSLTKLKAE